MLPRHSPPTRRGTHLLQERSVPAFSTVRHLQPEECFLNHPVFLPNQISVPPPPADPHVAEDKFERTRPFLARCPPKYIHRSVSRCRTPSQVRVRCPGPVLSWLRMAQIYVCPSPRPFPFPFRS